MLMIKLSEGERGYILKLEGKLLRPWIDELALACIDARIERLSEDRTPITETPGGGKTGKDAPPAPPRSL